MDRKDAGFTLIEAVIVMAIVAIGLTLGLPAFLEAGQRTRVATTINLLSSDMAMARSSAVVRRSVVAVCPRTRGEQRCNVESDWSDGWIVFADADGNRQPDASTDLLRVTDAPGSALLFLPASRSLLGFLPDGRAAGTNLTVNICRDDRIAAQVVVNNLGRVRSSHPDAEAACPANRPD